MSSLRTLFFASILNCSQSLADASAGKPDDGHVVLHCGQLVDVRAGKLLGLTSVVVADGVIKSVRAGRVHAEGVPSIDLSTKTCLPSRSASAPVS